MNSQKLEDLYTYFLRFFLRIIYSYITYLGCLKDSQMVGCYFWNKVIFPFFSLRRSWALKTRGDVKGLVFRGWKREVGENMDHLPIQPCVLPTVRKNAKQTQNAQYATVLRCAFLLVIPYPSTSSFSFPVPSSPHFNSFLIHKISNL